MNTIDKTIQNQIIKVFADGNKFGGYNQATAVKPSGAAPGASGFLSHFPERVIGSLRGFGRFGQYTRRGVEDGLVVAMDGITSGSTFETVRSHAILSGEDPEHPLDLIEMIFINATDAKLSFSIVVPECDVITELPEVLTDASILLAIVAKELDREPVSVELFVGSLIALDSNFERGFSMLRQKPASTGIEVRRKAGIDNYRPEDVRTR